MPVLAASDYGLMVAVGVIFLLFLIVGWVIVQGTRAQLQWRKGVEAGDVALITIMVGDELARWKTMRMPKGTDPAVWHGVQSADLLEARPDGVRVSAQAEAQYGLVEGRRREVASAVEQAMRVTAKIADMVMYDIPNVRLPHVQVDVYRTFNDEAGSTQKCIMSTLATREVADGLAWDEMDAEEVVRSFGGRFLLDDRGNTLPIDPDETTPSGVPAAFYKDE